MLLRYRSSYLRHLSFAGLFVIFIFCLFYCFDYLLQISISVFLPNIQQEFMLNDLQLGAIGAVFFISYSIMQIPSGYFLDHYGTKKTAILMTFFLTLGTLIMYLSNNYYLLLLSRLFIGLGASAAFVTAIFATAQWIPQRYFAFFIGVLQALSGIGAIFGQAPIAFLNEKHTWNEIALLFAFVSFIFFIIFIFIIGSVKKDKNTQTFTLKKHNSNNNFAFSKIINKTILKLSILSFIAWSPVASLAGFWMVQYLHTRKGLTVIDSSSTIITFWIGMILGALLIPIISEILRKRKPILIIGFLIQLVAFIIICYNTTNITTIAICLFFLGLISPIQGFCIVIAKDIFKKNNLGVTSSIINLFGVLSGGTMQLVIGFLLTYLFSNSKHPYIMSFYSYIILSLIGLVIAVFGIKESHPFSVKL